MFESPEAQAVENGLNLGSAASNFRTERRQFMIKWVGKSEDGSTVTLKKWTGCFSSPEYATADWYETNRELVRYGVVVDVETTGLDRAKDKVIEIGLLRFAFNRSSGEILSVENSYSAFQDPGEPLSEEVKAITGITDLMLKGQSIDWIAVDRLVADAHIIIAHNASFDRPFIDLNVQSSSSKAWGCSLKHIDWTIKGHRIHKLEVLSIYHGFFTDSHRALNDASALLFLLTFRDENTGLPYLHELLLNARRAKNRVIAAHSPFESKDTLKARGYSWDAGKKYWYKISYHDEVEAEIAWLEANVYKGEFVGSTQEIRIFDSFKTIT